MTQKTSEPVRAHENDEPTRRVDPRRILAEVGVAVLPTVALLVVSALGPEGAAGRFRGALAGMVVITAIGAFGTGTGTARALRTALRRVAVPAFLAGVAYGLHRPDDRHHGRAPRPRRPLRSA